MVRFIAHLIKLLLVLLSLPLVIFFMITRLASDGADNVLAYIQFKQKKKKIKRGL